MRSSLPKRRLMLLPKRRSDGFETGVYLDVGERPLRASKRHREGDTLAPRRQLTSPVLVKGVCRLEQFAACLLDRAQKRSSLQLLGHDHAEVTVDRRKARQRPCPAGKVDCEHRLQLDLQADGAAFQVERLDHGWMQLTEVAHRLPADEDVRAPAGVEQGSRGVLV